MDDLTEIMLCKISTNNFQSFIIMEPTSDELNKWSKTHY